MRLFIDALWSPAGKGLTSWLSLVMTNREVSLSHWYPGSGVVLDCIDFWSLSFFLLCKRLRVWNFRTFTIAKIANYGKCSKILNASCLLKRTRQTVQTQIRLPLQKQSDQGLLCFLCWQAFCESQPWKQTFCLRAERKNVWNFRTFTIAKITIYSKCSKILNTSCLSRKA